MIPIIVGVLIVVLGGDLLRFLCNGRSYFWGSYFKYDYSWKIYNGTKTEVLLKGGTNERLCRMGN